MNVVVDIPEGFESVPVPEVTPEHVALIQWARAEMDRRKWTSKGPPEGDTFQKFIADFEAHSGGKFTVRFEEGAVFMHIDEMK